MDKVLTTVLGAAGSVLSTLFGNWSEAMTTLVIFMAVDCLSGLAVAAIFKNSTKTDSGDFEFCAGLKCLVRKVGTLALIIIAYRVDILSGTDGHLTRDAVALALCINESVSIVSNLGRMGLKIPEPLSRAIGLLKNTTKDESEEDE